VDGALRHGVWLVPVLCLLGALAEAALQPVRRRFGESQPLRGAIRLGGFGMAGVVAACPLIAAACSVRPLGMFVVEGPFATAPPTPGRYAAEVLGAMAASVRLSDHEHLMVNSFWTGFGWLDVITLSALAASLHTLSWLALVGLAWRLAASGDARRVLWLGVIGLGLLVSLVVYSQATLSLMRNLHGRYLLGWYLVALSLAWSWLPSAPARSRLVVGFAAATAAAAHSWSLCAVLARYF
jgi:hypothetical protein